MKRVCEIAVSLLIGLFVGHLVFFAAVSALCLALAFLQRPACTTFDIPIRDRERIEAALARVKAMPDEQIVAVPTEASNP